MFNRYRDKWGALDKVIHAVAGVVHCGRTELWCLPDLGQLTALRVDHKIDALTILHADKTL